MKSGILIAGLVALSLAGCAEMSGGPRPAATGSAVSASATVVSVNQKTREVVLRAPDNTLIGIVAGPEVRNLAQVSTGDTVTVSYFESTLLTMGDAGKPVATIGAARAPKGALPGGLAGVNTNTVVTVVSYNADSALATFRTADGAVHRATVPPELRNFAAARVPGSQVTVSMTQAVAVSITEG